MTLLCEREREGEGERNRSVRENKERRGEGVTESKRGEEFERLQAPTLPPSDVTHRQWECWC